MTITSDRDDWPELAARMRALGDAVAARDKADGDVKKAQAAKDEADIALPEAQAAKVSADESVASTSASPTNVAAAKAASRRLDDAVATAEAAAKKLESAKTAAKAAATKVFDEWQLAYKAYISRLNDFLRLNEDGFYVLGPQYKRGSDKLEPDSKTELEIRFGDAPGSASIDRLLATFGLDAILEESNALKYRSLMTQRIEEAATSLRAYREKLLGDSVTIKDAADEWFTTGGWGGFVNEKSKPNLALVQLAVFARVASELAENSSGQDEGRMKFQARAFDQALKHSGSAIARMSILARALRDQSIRDEVTVRMQPLAQTYQENAGHPLAPLQAIWWLFVAGMAASALVLTAANVLSPFGPVLTFGFVAAPIAIAVGLWLARSNAEALTWTRAQKDTFRKYVISSLRGSPEGEDEEDALRALGQKYTFIEQEPLPDPKPGPFDWLGRGRKRADATSRQRSVPQPVPYREGDWEQISHGHLDQVLKDPHEESIRFGGKPAPTKANSLTASLLLGAFFCAAGVDSVQVLLPSLSAAVPGLSASAQVLRHTVGRESCEVANGRLVWQDEAHIFVVVATGEIVSIARSDTSEVRFGGSRTKAAPCATQSRLFADSDTTITNTTTPIAVNVPVTSSPDNGASTTTTVSFQSNVVLDGQQITVNPNQPDQRYVILPLSKNPIEGLGNVVTNQSDYYDRSYRLYFEGDVPDKSWFDQVRTSAFAEEMREQVEPVAAALHTSAYAGCMISLKVKGYASDKSFPPGAPEANYYLAEGRRAAALWELGFRPPKPDGAPTEVTMELSDTSVFNFGATMTEISYEGGGGLRLIDEEADYPKDADAARMIRRPLFESERTMRDDLKTWYSEPPGAEKRLQESIARSAVIQISDGAIRCPGRSATAD